MRIRAAADDGAIIEFTVVGADADQDVEAELARRWPPFGLRRLDADGDATGPDAADPVASVEVHVGIASGWDRLESELGLFAAERLAGHVAVHAAMIVHEGRAILVPGSSHAGKTTLSVAALDAGLTVASDEFALVDVRNGLVHGWPRSLRIRLPGGGVERRPLPPSANDPVPVGMVAAVRFDPHGPGLTEISRSDAVMAVLENCVCGALRPTDSFEAALAVTVGAVCLGGTHDDAADALARLVTLASGG